MKKNGAKKKGSEALSIDALRQSIRLVKQAQYALPGPISWDSLEEAEDRIDVARDLLEEARNKIYGAIGFE